MTSTGFMRAWHYLAASKALGHAAAELQRRQLVEEFEAALLAGDLTGDKIPFAFKGVF